MQFELSSLEMILSEEQMAIRHETKDKVVSELEGLRRRVSYDAWVIQETCKRTLDETLS